MLDFTWTGFPKLGGTELEEANQNENKSSRPDLNQQPFALIQS